MLEEDANMGRNGASRSLVTGIGEVVLRHSVMPVRRKCLDITIIMLFVLLVVVLNLLYFATKNFVRVKEVHHQRSSTAKKSQSNVAWPSGYHPPNTYGFYPVNEKGVYSFWNVCIEAVQLPVIRDLNEFGQKFKFNETAKIIVYNSFYREGEQQINVAGSHNTDWNHWTVHFRRGKIPSTHAFQNNTVFFVAQTCPANFHHFWIDEFVALYCVVKRANKLYRKANNQILYRRPTNVPGTDIGGCYNKTRYEDILRTLHVNKFHDVFYQAPINTCWSSAVFGAHPFVNDPKTIVNHVLKYTFQNLSAIHDKMKSYFITFIQRQTRRIINIRELLKAAQWLGYRRVRIIDFERHSVQEQMQIAASTCVMVGVQGAGLQWAIFMPTGCNLIEIAWPAQHWGFHFRTYVEPYGINHFSLRATNAKVNWTAYEQLVRHGQEVPLEERIQMLNKKPTSPSIDNIWKFADAFVSKERFSDILSSIDPHPRPRPTEPLPTPSADLLDSHDVVASPNRQTDEVEREPDDSEEEQKSMLI